MLFRSQKRFWTLSVLYGIASYGNRAFDDTLLELKDTMEQARHVNGIVLKTAEIKMKKLCGGHKPNLLFSMDSDM